MKRFGFGFLSDRKRKNVCCLSLRKARSKVLCLVACGRGYEQDGSSGRLLIYEEHF